MKTWHYYLPNQNGEGWAHILITESGMFSAVSDWGNYAYLWTHHGSTDFREFFLSAERDWQYFAHKLRPEKILNEEASFKRMREEILRQRRVGDLTKEQADNVWAALSEHESWVAFINSDECREAFDEPWEYSVNEYHSDVVSFCKRVLPRLAEQIKAELSGKPHLSHVLDVVLARRENFHITQEQRLQLIKLFPRGMKLSEDWVKTSCDVRGDKLYPYRFPWNGTRQGIEYFVEMLKAFEGTAEIVLLWNTGERTGYRLANHRVTEHKVDLLLV